MHRYLRSKLATDWDEPTPDISILDRVSRKLKLKIMENPTYQPKMHLVKEWLIEFDGDLPWREIGIDSNGEPVLAGPTSVDYGFWHDTNMQYSDFDGVIINPSEFEEYWVKSAKVRGGEDL